MTKLFVEKKMNNQVTMYFKDEERKIYHREDGPAIEWENGDKFWYKDGKCHREDGPAVDQMNGIQAWYINGIRHREDGPARIFPYGRNQYWLNGKRLSKQKWEQAIQSINQ